jgi:hypothetical protein
MKIYNILTKYKLLPKKEEIVTTTKPLPSPLQGVKDKDKELNKDMDLDKGDARGRKEEFEAAVDEYFSNQPVSEKNVYHNPENFNEEEYVEAVKFLRSSRVFILVQQHYRRREDQVLILFKTFYEQKNGFNELRNKSPNDIMKWFYQWVPKYLQSAKAPTVTGSVVKNQISKAETRQQKYN